MGAPVLSSTNKRLLKQAVKISQSIQITSSSEKVKCLITVLPLNPSQTKKKKKLQKFNETILRAPKSREQTSKYTFELPHLIKIIFNRIQLYFSQA